MTMLKGYFGVYLSIALGIFIFVLFFQPFPLERFDFNNRLIFIAGLGAIVFLFMVFVRLLFLLLFPNDDQEKEKPLLHEYLRSYSLFILCSLSFAFYLRYVGMVRITFFMMLKVMLICLTVPVTLRLYEIIQGLKVQNEFLMKEKRAIQKRVEQFEDDYLHKSVSLHSENGSEAITLMISEMVFIRSADNYVEVVYNDAEGFKRKLIRNTLKSIEQQISMYSSFIRCHRICIINMHFIEKLHNSGGYWITIKGYDEKIPVSRQYLLKLREVV